jgi:hypothetical protein
MGGNMRNDDKVMGSILPYRLSVTVFGLINNSNQGHKSVRGGQYDDKFSSSGKNARGRNFKNG